MKDFNEIIWTSFILLVIAIIIGVLIAFPVMWIWNALMPVIFGLKTITFWQAFGLTMLCDLLFKGEIHIKD